MNPSITFTTTTRLLLSIWVLRCFALLPQAHAVTPAPDGGYPGGNTAEGQGALLGLTSGGYNTAIGFSSLGRNITGNFNTGVGAGTLIANTADKNTATGAGALLGNTTGGFNTANGAFALAHNTTGYRNNAVGFLALSSNTTSGFNNAVGGYALYSNQTGVENDALGDEALLSNVSGSRNVAIGDSALLSTGANDNTAVGANALQLDTTGFENTAVGTAALYSNSTGIVNTAIGSHALFNNATGNNNIALGDHAGENINGNGNITIGNPGVAGDGGTIRIGTDSYLRTYIGGIAGAILSGGIQVYIGPDGQLGTGVSSRRFKKDIRAMDKASESIMALKPVTFRYKSDRINTAQFGLIAEEVAEVNPDLVVRDKENKPYSVRYDAVNAMLLNEFLKQQKAFLEEQRKVERQEATIADLSLAMVQQRKNSETIMTQEHREIEALTVRFNEQAAQIQKMSAQIESNKPPAQRVVLSRP